MSGSVARPRARHRVCIQSDYAIVYAPSHAAGFVTLRVMMNGTLDNLDCHACSHSLSYSDKPIY